MAGITMQSLRNRGSGQQLAAYPKNFSKCNELLMTGIARDRYHHP
jgi:hypothetical protein